MFRYLILLTVNFSVRKPSSAPRFSCFSSCLVRLDVSFNEITSLVGLKKLFGPGYSLTAIILQGNQIQSKSHILECLKNLVNLRQLVLLNPQTGDSNPVCGEPGKHIYLF